MGWRQQGQGLGVLKAPPRQMSSLCSLSLISHTPQSLCYQLPSVALRETMGFKCATVVISPLISLMEDQVAGLRSNGKYEPHGAVMSKHVLTYPFHQCRHRRRGAHRGGQPRGGGEGRPRGKELNPRMRDACLHC